MTIRESRKPNCEKTFKTKRAVGHAQRAANRERRCAHRACHRIGTTCDFMAITRVGSACRLDRLIWIERYIYRELDTKLIQNSFRQLELKFTV